MPPRRSNPGSGHANPSRPRTSERRQSQQQQQHQHQHHQQRARSNHNAHYAHSPPPVHALDSGMTYSDEDLDAEGEEIMHDASGYETGEDEEEEEQVEHQGEEEEEGEGEQEEEEEEEEDDDVSETSSADFDPLVDPEGFAKRLDELAGLREISVREERAIKAGPVFFGAGKDKRAPVTAPLPFPQLKKYIYHLLDSTEWKYAQTSPDGHYDRAGSGPVHPIRVTGREWVGQEVGDRMQAMGIEEDVDLITRQNTYGTGRDVLGLEGLPGQRMDVDVNMIDGLSR